MPSEPLHNSRLGTSRYIINCNKEHRSILISAVAYRIPNKVRLDNLKPNAVFQHVKINYSAAGAAGSGSLNETIDRRSDIRTPRGIITSRGEGV